MDIIHCLQLEKIIGKLKTQKYGDKILEVIGKHEPNESQGQDSLNEEEQETSVKTSAKRPRNKKVVVIESSGDES